MPKAKKFIDRKNAVTFNLVHRSQRDPLAADESAPQRVLVPVNVAVPAKKDKEPEFNVEQRRQVQHKYGIFFDDDYNYLQHLKDTREVTMLLQPKPSHKKKEKSETKPVTSTEETAQSLGEKLNLPSSVFASEVEEDVGLLNKAAPQGIRLDLDPEVVAAMDDDFNFDDPDNELEDNFMDLAMAEGSDDDEDDSSEDDTMSASEGSQQGFASDGDWEDDGSDEEKEQRMPSWDKEESRSRFSQYSMSSSVVRRNEGLTMLDRRFEKMFAEYDDTEVGALDCEEIDGHLGHHEDMLLQAAEDLERRTQKYSLDKEKEIARMQRLQQIEEESDSEEELVRVPVHEAPRWDCESILSTRSTLYNHPKLIHEPKKPRKIKINPSTGIPLETLGENKLTARSLAAFNAQAPARDKDDVASRADTVLSALSVLSLRAQDESAEEKRERKRLLREYRKERRVEKKANKEAFRDEKKRQEKIQLNNRNNVQGNRIL